MVVPLDKASIRVFGFVISLCFQSMRSHQTPDELIQAQLEQLILDALSALVLGRR